MQAEQEFLQDFNPGFVPDFTKGKLRRYAGSSPTFLRARESELWVTKCLVPAICYDTCSLFLTFRCR